MTYAAAIDALASAVGVAKDPGTVADALATEGRRRAHRHRQAACDLAIVVKAIRAGDERRVIARAPFVLAFL